MQELRTGGEVELIDTIIGIVLWTLVILGIMVLAIVVSDDDGGNDE